MTNDKPSAIAIDFGGTSIKMGVTRGEELVTVAPPIPTGAFGSPQAIIEAMIATARELRNNCPDVAAIGMGMPGWCDYHRGILYQLTNVPVWDHEVPVLQMMEEALKLPAVLDNDANCMAYAEWKMGAGKGLQSLVCLTMGTGIGGGMVMFDRMVRGRRVSAAELGQTSIDYQGRRDRLVTKGPLRNTLVITNWLRMLLPGMPRRVFLNSRQIVRRVNWSVPPGRAAPLPWVSGRIVRISWPV